MTESDKQRLQSLLNKYLEGSISSVESRELAELSVTADRDLLSGVLKDYWNTDIEIVQLLSNQESDAMFSQIISPRKSKILKLNNTGLRLFRLAAAVLLLIGIGFGGYRFFLAENQVKEITQPVISAQEILPGGNKAVLTLSDGAKLVLDDVQNGVIAREDEAQIIKLEDGQIAYQGKAQEARLMYNTVNTPRGGQYRITLPDGTVAYLNASSMIHFPVSFDKKERRVEIAGEVYFEVAKKEKWPFRVVYKDMVVEALGTRFNVMGYEDEAQVQTTLLSGSVKISNTEHSVILKPGQQAAVPADGNLIVKDSVNTEIIMAWKEGWFRFSATGLHNVMRQISRWYDLEVVYEGTIPNKKYTGIVSRNSTLDEVLKIMESAGIKFTVKEKVIYVSN